MVQTIAKGAPRDDPRVPRWSDFSSTQALKICCCAALHPVSPWNALACYVDSKDLPRCRRRLFRKMRLVVWLEGEMSFFMLGRAGGFERFCWFLPWKLRTWSNLTNIFKCVATTNYCRMGWWVVHESLFWKDHPVTPLRWGLHRDCWWLPVIVKDCRMM